MTIDKTRVRPARGTLPAFAPVPRLRARHDGWTAERQRGFIEALADTGSVRAAAHAVNMTPEGAYLLRRHPQAAGFRKAWEAALALGVQRLEDLAMERALHGQEVPVYSYGKLIGSRVVYNDRLLMFLLRSRAPARFAAEGRAAARKGSMGSPHASELSRLKRKWRKEWQAEQDERERAEDEATTEEIDAAIDGLRRQWLDEMSPRVRAAYEAYRRVDAEEAGEPYIALPPPRGDDDDGSGYEDGEDER